MPKAAVVGIVLVLSCATPLVTSPERTWPRQNSLEMAPSHRCQGGSCTCRDVADEKDQLEKRPPAEGFKRFELRLLPTPDAAWVEVEGRGILYKDSATSSGSCAYVDLPVGRRVRVSYHVAARQPTAG